MVAISRFPAMAVSSLYQLLVTQGDQVWHSAGLFTVSVSGRGGIPVGLFGPANEMAFSLRFRFVGASLGMTEISRASDHFSSAPDGLFRWPRRCCCDPFGPHCWAGTGAFAWAPFTDYWRLRRPTHRLPLSGLTQGVGSSRRSWFGAPCSWPCMQKTTVGGQSQGMWWSSEARPTFCVT
ncbi:hypothetical protein B0J15DRAFT_220342 [Fusarium solani]|uniref:Uncharacterized protein n=1 Tax=Fusarium solani TaxID=169388 RepID=A0A9P9RAF3_FUSSL|nr:uncharacterized protein B0J15DRAFT_220342 [Fusarium solani]KAH7271599.1 hypothetical protein B0J15DRAFT_220342 [Fusarium solani]